MIYGFKQKQTLALLVFALPLRSLRLCGEKKALSFFASKKTFT
jgi:hypothetical protein